MLATQMATSSVCPVAPNPEMTAKRLVAAFAEPTQAGRWSFAGDQLVLTVERTESDKIMPGHKFSFTVLSVAPELINVRDFYDELTTWRRAPNKSLEPTPVGGRHWPGVVQPWLLGRSREVWRIGGT